MKINNRISGFTLVELVVVITILAILGTIAFLSVQGYTKSARDGVRIKDIGTILAGLDLFEVQTGLYPDPTNPTTITYSGSELWLQGEFGESVKVNIAKMDNLPTDPLTKHQYTYSISSSKKEYQVASIFEGNKVSFSPIVSSVHAAGVYKAFVKGNYNGVMAKLDIGSESYIFSVPSIVVNTTAITDIEQLNIEKAFVYNGSENLPASYTNLGVSLDAGKEFQSKKLLVFSGSTSALISNNNERKELFESLQLAYSGTVFSDKGNIGELVNYDIDSEDLNTFTLSLVREILGMDADADSKLPGFGGKCSEEDIEIGLYTIAACNVGITKAGTGASALGRFFQWGEMYGWKNSDGVSSSDNIQYPSGIAQSSWSNSVTDTATGGIDRWGLTGSKRGPCEEGYHVPSQSEWSGILSAGGWMADFSPMMNTLYLPFASGGLIKAPSNGAMVTGVGFLYWSSTSSSVDGEEATALNSMGTPGASIGLVTNPMKTIGAPIRCFKD